MMASARHSRGVVLLVVLFFALLLSSSIASFLSRSTVDAIIARNRENAARADALARGGVRLAQALLLEDRLREQAESVEPIDGHLDLWARSGGLEIDVGEGGTLLLNIEDSGKRLNLNALFDVDETGARVPVDETEPFLIAFFEKVIDELPLPPGERVLYDARELGANLIDWVDSDDVRLLGGPEDNYYQEQDPPYRAANQPLFSVDELRLVEGFDGVLVDALRPYVSVYPFAPGGCGNAAIGCGVNLNSAPPHVLAILFYNDGVDQRLASEDVVRAILRARQDGSGVCAEGQSSDDCTPIREIVPNPIFPPPTFASEIFVVNAEAEVAEIRRSVEAVVDRSEPTQPRLLSWRVR
jgi:general secretion pathway protein K